jgi:hypothetical protein
MCKIVFAASIQQLATTRDQFDFALIMGMSPPLPARSASGNWGCL